MNVPSANPSRPELRETARSRVVLLCVIALGMVLVAAGSAAPFAWRVATVASHRHACEALVGRTRREFIALVAPEEPTIVKDNDSQTDFARSLGPFGYTRCSVRFQGDIAVSARLTSSRDRVRVTLGKRHE